MKTILEISYYVRKTPNHFRYKYHCSEEAGLIYSYVTFSVNILLSLHISTRIFFSTLKMDIKLCFCYQLQICPSKWGSESGALGSRNKAAENPSRLR